MITEEERIIRKSQGYDLGFEHNGKKYWINTNNWNDEKEERLFLETGLKSFREESGNKNLVLYDPEYFEISWCSGWFLHYKGGRECNIPQPINASNTNLMFYYCVNLTLVDLSHWEMSKIIDMESMFSYCINLTSLDLSNWDISNVKNMRTMFFACESIKSLDLCNWDVSEVENMDYMFAGCENLISLKMNDWDVSHVENMHSMFDKCHVLHSKYNTEIAGEIIHRALEENSSCKIAKLNIREDKELFRKIIENSDNKPDLELLNAF